MDKKPIQVLFFEDNPGDVRLIREFLREDDPDQFALRHAERLETGLKYLTQEKPDVILLDLGLPDSQGLETFTKVYTQAPEVPIVILTGLDDTGKAIEAVTVGAQDYLVKGEISGGLLVRVIRYEIERKRVEERLRESEEKYRNVVERANDGIAIIQGTIVKYLNPRLAEMWGGTIEEALGTPFTNFIHPDELPAVLDRYKRRTAGEEITPIYETILKRKDDSKIYAELNAGMIMFQGEPADLVIVRDITERKQAEEALRENEQRLASIYTTVGDVIFYLAVEPGGQYRFASVNQAFCRVTGIPMEQVVGRKVNEIIPEPSLTMVLGKYRLAIQEKDIVRWEETSDYPTGRLVGEVSVAPVFDETGKCTYLVGSVHDITERKRAEEALRESEDKFKHFFDHSNVGKSITQISGEISVNQAFCELLDYSPEELQRKKWQEITHPDDIALTQREIDSLLSGEKEAVRFNKRYLKKDGSVIWTDLSSTLRRDKQGQPLYLMSSVIDITERKRAEEALRASQRQYKTLSEISPVGIFHTDAGGRTSYVNPRWCEISGLTGEEALGDGWLSAVHPDDRKMITAGWDNAVQELRTSTSEYRFLRPDGTIRWVIGQATPETSVEGKIVGYVGTITDITERKQAEESLRESEERFTKAFRSIPDALVISRLEDGKILEVNDSWHKVFGYSREEVIGKSSLVLNLFAESVDRQRVIAMLNKQGFVRDFELQIRQKSGALRTAILSVELQEIQGEQYMLSVIQDITERKQAEEALRKSQQETAHANQLLLALSQAAQAVQRAKTQEEVYGAIQEQMIHLGCKATVFELTHEGEDLRIVYLNYAANVVRRAEKMTGLSMVDYHFHPRQGNIFQRVLAQGETVHVEDTALAVADALPKRLRLLARPVTDLLHLQPSTFAALMVDDEAIGVLSITGLDLTEADNPAVTAFARQAAIAIQNARLYEQAQQEINERKRAEEKLREGEKKWHDIFELLPVGVSIVDSKNQVKDTNPALAQILDLSREDLLKGKFIGRKYFRSDKTLMPPEEFPSTRAINEQKIIRDVEIGVEKEDETIIWTSVSATPLSSGTGSATVTTDITERKQAEEQIHQLNAGLEQRVEERTRELQQAQEQLVRKEKLAVLGELAGGVGHELRNPLGIISGAIYYLKLVQPEADGKIKQYHDMIAQETLNAEKIITDLLDFARVSAMEREALPVPELVERVLRRFPVLPTVEVKLRLPDKLPMIFADVHQMEQVLGNLTINACQAMDNGGRLTISARRQKGWVAIAVKDTGTGITPENMQKIFEPLFTTKAKGIGLGLAVSKKLAEANGGRIEVKSEAGEGSTFTLYVPLKQ